MRLVLALALALSVAVAWPASATAEAQDVPEWPSEQVQRLSQLESDLLETQRRLAAARREQNTSAVEKLSKEFKELQDERVQLLRTTGALPR